jgi:hypothetical protein
MQIGYRHDHGIISCNLTASVYSTKSKILQIPPQNCETNVLACHSATNATIRMATIHKTSAAGRGEFTQ